MNKREFLRIYSGLFKTSSYELGHPTITLDVLIMPEQKAINGIATIIDDPGNKTIIRSKLRGTNNKLNRLNNETFLISFIGYPLEEKIGFSNPNSYGEENLDIHNQLPNLKLLLRIDSSWRRGIASYKYRTHCNNRWVNETNVSIDLSQDCLKQVA